MFIFRYHNVTQNGGGRLQLDAGAGGGAARRAPSRTGKIHKQLLVLVGHSCGPLAYFKHRYLQTPFYTLGDIVSYQKIGSKQ